MRKLDVIIPTYNEEGNIEELVRRIDVSLSGAGISYSIIFIDDHSTDSTVEVIKKESQKHINGKNGAF